MATSVPVPIARPRSAWASAGASLTPSPTIATTRPSACRRRMTSALSAGRTSAMTSSMPTSAATARAVVSLSPVSRTGRRPSAFSDATASAELSLDGVGDDEHARSPGRPSRRRSRSARAPRRPGGRRRARAARCIAQSASSAGRPDDQRVAVDDALDAEALAVGEALDRRQRARPPRRPWRWPGRSGARRRARARRRAAAPRSRSTPSATVTSTRRHPAGGHGAGLVEHDRVDAAGGLEDLGALDQQAELGAAAGADHQRRRRGQAERARAGDDQHGDGGGERERRALAGAEPEPERAERRAR